jgi:uncharacterized membrane protein YeiH
MKIRSAGLVVGLDLAGTFLFAAEGSSLAIQGRFDLLGVGVIAFVASLGGGLLRDVLIGDTPPAAIRDWRYPTVAFIAAILTFAARDVLAETPRWVLIALDAAALASFAIAGAEKALDAGLNGLSATLMGGLTGVGGGAARDVLLGHEPTVLRTDFYATAALAGSLAMICARRLGLPVRLSAPLGIVLCFGLRMAGAWWHWRLPGAVS